MKKEKSYDDVRFSPDVIRKATEILDSFTDKQKNPIASWERTIDTGIEKWYYDTDEEFFADLRKDHVYAYYQKNPMYFSLEIWEQGRTTRIAIRAPEKKQILAIFEVFEENVDKYKLSPLPEPPKPKPIIFIGHGRNEQWRELKDHLQEKHSYKAEAYETGARAGHEIRDILEEMLDKASFAVLVMTGEDEAEGGKMRARQNVVHELGLFQGRLGFTRAIALLEEGTEDFSNLNGIQQIRYGKGNIKETFGEVLATLKREFKD